MLQELKGMFDGCFYGALKNYVYKFLIRFPNGNGNITLKTNCVYQPPPLFKPGVFFQCYQKSCVVVFQRECNNECTLEWLYINDIKVAGPRSVLIDSKTFSGWQIVWSVCLTRVPPSN